jgi:predicted ATPase/class 3 adenylate cyclase
VTQEAIGRELPTGTVSFVFTDIEGSTRLLQAAGESYGELLSTHRTLILDAATAHGGRLIGTEGDALFLAFDRAAAAIEAAAEAQRALDRYAWPADRTVRVRMGIHTGQVVLIGSEYVGLPLHTAARIAAAGHGGQVLVSEATRVLAADELPEGLALRDLGQHRLKDLAQAERLYELEIVGLDRSFPPPRTLDVRPNNLPIQLTTFIGRDELAEARRLLERTRLLTLTGPGGTGKTRLALQLAAELSDTFPDGVFFVPLETITSPELIPSAILEALGIAAGSGPPLDRLVDYLRARRALLVLDNFEQVVIGGEIVARLLREAPEIKAIVTSRIVLRTSGEQEYVVPPLRLPKSGSISTAEAAAGVEAVRLFVERAMASQPSFALTDANAAAVADIVTRLDGLPLAIELAAARVKILPVDVLRNRLDDRLSVLTGGARDLPGRQQTLRGAIDWSYDLLDDADRRLFARFAVFAGGACLSQAEEVCGPASELEQEVLDGLASLAEKSLLRPVPGSETEPRFAMLATIREYALQRLEVSDDAELLRRRHADAFVALAEGSAADLTGPTGGRLLNRLELDHDNFRAAIDWAIQRDEAGSALRLLAALWRFWQIRGHLFEGQELAARILALPSAAEQPAAVRARALGAAGSIAYWRGDAPEIKRLYTEALEAARASNDRSVLAEALYNHAFAANNAAWVHDAVFEADEESIAEALEIYRSLGDERGIAGTSWALGLPAITRRDWDAARRYIGDSLAAYRAAGDSFGEGWALFEQSLIESGSGDLEAAEANVRAAMAIFAASADLSAIVFLLYASYDIARRKGDMERGLRLAAAADALRERTGTDLAIVGPWPELVAPAKPTEDPALIQAWDDGSRLTPEEAIAYALSGTLPDTGFAGADARRHE